MSETAIEQVEDLIADRLRAYADLSDWTVLTDLAEDEAIPFEDYPAIAVGNAGVTYNVAFEQGSSLHEAILLLEFYAGRESHLGISRTQQQAAALCNAALCPAGDTSLGGAIHDIIPVDLAKSSADTREAGATSMQFRVQFFTPAHDFFTLIS